MVKKVAASNATTEEKAAADYVCDSTRDDIDIRAAILAETNLTNQWTHYQSTPVMNFGDFALFWYDGTTYHAFYAYDSYTKIGHATSPDGITWTEDTTNNPILSVGTGSAWDKTSVAVPNVWKEGSTWYMLYRGSGTKIGLATAPAPEGPWTKSPSNPVLNVSVANDPAGLMKAGSTYYLYTNTTGGNRQVDVFTSTNLTSWTKQSPPEGIFSGGRYCSCPFKYAGYYYILVSCYYNSTYGGCIEIYKSLDPTFVEHNREFLGAVIVDTVAQSVDTPSVLTTDINRDTFVGGFMCYYSKMESPASGPATYPAYLTVEDDPATAIAKVSNPSPGTVELSSGTFNISTLAGSPSFESRFGLTIQGQGASTIVKLIDSLPVSVSNRGVVFVDYNSKLKDMVLDGNTSHQTHTQTGLMVGVDGEVDTVTLKNWSSYPADVYGILKDAVYNENSLSPRILFNGKIIESGEGGGEVIIQPTTPKRLVKRGTSRQKTVRHGTILR
jgi:hypothetical protein